MIIPVGAQKERGRGKDLLARSLLPLVSLISHNPVRRSNEKAKAKKTQQNTRIHSLAFARSLVFSSLLFSSFRPPRRFQKSRARTLPKATDSLDSCNFGHHSLGRFFSS